MNHVSAFVDHLSRLSHLPRDVACLLAEALDYASLVRWSRTTRHAHEPLAQARVLQPMPAAAALLHPRAPGRWSSVILAAADEWTSLARDQPLRAARVRILELAEQFTSPIEQLVLPATLTSLHLSACFNHPIGRLQLPATLTSLHLGACFNHPIEQLALPPALTSLDIGFRIKRSAIERVHLPPNLTSLMAGDVPLLPRACLVVA